MPNPILELSEFRKKVYYYTSRIPKGFVSTYGDIARLLGSHSFSRAVGIALNRNPYPPNIVPCHRVVMSDGRVGGYAGGVDVKVNKLREEGVRIQNGKIDLSKYKVDMSKLI